MDREADKKLIGTNGYVEECRTYCCFTIELSFHSSHSSLSDS
ncbi:hypothetical protein HMPREF0673_02014 [Leyella stercorea DSM 18206]|uniref:Uncharacterized protein n=2 Tax=root TaxID=1 RepID=G6AZF0_9BACT|nr:hypothetical protein HMPREF0673_02014 [Leyella stercorea DSM 18206]